MVGQYRHQPHCALQCINNTNELFSFLDYGEYLKYGSPCTHTVVIAGYLDLSICPLFFTSLWPYVSLPMSMSVPLPQINPIIRLSVYSCGTCTMTPKCFSCFLHFFLALAHFDLGFIISSDSVSLLGICVSTEDCPLSLTCSALFASLSWDTFSLLHSNDLV